MAQHYPVNIEEEPKIRKSLERIGKYIARASWVKSKELEIQIIYTKQITVLPADYRTEEGDSFVISIGFYNFQGNKGFDETNERGTDFTQSANLEVHFDRKGNINKVYYPL